MSVQFGRWNFDGQPADPRLIEQVRSLLSPYAPDGLTVQTADCLTLVFGAFHTTNEAAVKTQPYLSPRGDRIMWDGRLDNRDDCPKGICSQGKEQADVELVADSYEFSGLDCFSHLIGDWAVSIWDPSARHMVLARDFLGTRQLYYSLEENCVVWSTILEPMILLRGRPLAICEKYIAGWLSEFPEASLTPYEQIFAVPPGHYAIFRKGHIETRSYWAFDREKKIRLRSDREYEEQFLAEFQKSVARRMRGRGPILAELSGGMDSSSIVCTADRLRSEDRLDCPRLDTVSYFNDMEPNWNERPYFAQVEKQRGREGFHIDVSSTEPLITRHSDHFLATPASDDPDSDFARRFSECISSGPYRVVLSGVGGDEVSGGIPTPLPELADHLVCLEFRRFVHQLFTWSVAKKKPILHLLFHTLNSFLPRVNSKQPPWLCSGFVRRNRAALGGYHKRAKLLGGLPTFQANLFALDALRRQLSCTPLPTGPMYEKRYPYLDRDFLAFCYSIPREQFVRPHQRRSLMRRAMAGIVPDGILSRRRKAYVVRRLVAMLSHDYDMFAKEGDRLLSASLGIVEPKAFLRSIEETRNGGDSPIIPILRAMALEQWLRSMTDRSLISCSFTEPASHIHGGIEGMPQRHSRPRTLQSERR